MKASIIVSFVAVVSTISLPQPAAADGSVATCNSIAGRAIGPAQHCWNFGCVPEDFACNQLGAAFIRFFDAPECVQALVSNDLDGLLSQAAVYEEGENAGDDKQIGDVGCSAIQDCGFCGAALALGICPTFCM